MGVIYLGDMSRGGGGDIVGGDITPEWGKAVNGEGGGHSLLINTRSLPSPL